MYIVVKLIYLEVGMAIVVAALYQFKSFCHYEEIRQRIYDVCYQQGVLGTLLIAKEGINGTISGSQEAIDSVTSYLKEIGFDAMELKFSHAHEDPFLRLKVVAKREIVTLGQNVDPCSLVGDYVDVDDWNELISRKDVLLIDTRNDYEYELGTFEGAVNPNTTCFREFPEYVRSIDQKKYKIVAMFCTGGIRCEKASSFMLQEGFEKVYHLKGGVLKYLEEMSVKESLWRGDCFVFDRRVALGHGLEVTGHVQCYACRRALTPQETMSEYYLEGISCHYCYHHQSAQKKQAVIERQRQVVLSKAANQRHIGD